MKELKEIQENLKRQFNELKNKISEQKGYFIKELENNLKKILELDNPIDEMKNAWKGIWNRTDHVEGRINELKDRNIEMILVKRKED